MVSFIDAEITKFKYNISIPNAFRTKASYFLSKNGLKKGIHWIRCDNYINDIYN